MRSFLLLALLTLPLPLAAAEFPPGFQWCVATSAHQIEGGNVHSDWWAFERQAGRIKTGELSGKAAGHWDRLEEDVALMKALGVTQYRFSLEWARLQPTEGRWDWEAVAHYKKELALLKAAGIRPLVTLMHFTLPQWVAAKGGWEWDGVADAFESYVAFAQRFVGPRVNDWITLNEPTVVLVNGYVTGEFPPGKQDLKLIETPAKNMVRAHAYAYRRLHTQAAEIGTDVRVGLAHHLRVFDPHQPLNPLDRMTARLLDRLFNWDFVDAVETGRLKMYVPLALDVDVELPEAEGTQDFVGINYYSRDMVRFTLNGPLHFERVVKEGAPVSDLGWEIYPQGLARIVKDATRRYPGKPILITENGLADAKDEKRAAFLRDHLEALSDAIAAGAPVEGYCHWSLLDNFEWAEGFTPRFGLYEVDYATLARKARPSAAVFREYTTK